jgi:DNA polymerase elongation subunit (family B)
MASKVNEIIAGEYNHTGKAIIYGDTDSCYFSAYKTLQKDIDAGNIEWSKENVIALYDNIGEEVNTTFPQFMLDTFHVPKTRGEVIKAGREIVGSKSLFITKKRYAVLYYDKEGKRADVDGKPGKIKAMGLDLKRSDTPEFIQNFLSDVLEMVLMGKVEQDVLDNVLPQTQGFFFGDDSADYYKEQDLEFIKNARYELFMGLKVFYNSSW